MWEADTQKERNKRTKRHTKRHEERSYLDTAILSPYAENTLKCSILNKSRQHFKRPAPRYPTYSTLAGLSVRT